VAVEGFFLAWLGVHPLSDAHWVTLSPGCDSLVALPRLPLTPRMNPGACGLVWVKANEILVHSQQLTAEAAWLLVNDLGLSTGNTAELLGISCQRVDQILRAA